MTQCNHSAYFVRVWLAATNAARKAVDRFADRSIAYERVPVYILGPFSLARMEKDR